jgi:hypothetical protein
MTAKKPPTMKIVEVPDDEYERMKREVADRALYFLVTGTVGIRDCVTRGTVKPGGIVRLDPDVKGNMLLVRSRAVGLIEDQVAAAAAYAGE